MKTVIFGKNDSRIFTFDEMVEQCGVYEETTGGSGAIFISAGIRGNFVVVTETGPAFFNANGDHGGWKDEVDFRYRLSKAKVRFSN